MFRILVSIEEWIKNICWPGMIIILVSYLLCRSLHQVGFFPVRLRNRLISGGLEPVLSHIEKSCIASNYTQFSKNIRIKLLCYFCSQMSLLTHVNFHCFYFSSNFLESFELEVDCNQSQGPFITNKQNKSKNH